MTLKIIAVLILLFASLIGVGLFLNQRAESKAAEFCDAIALGSDHSKSIERAEADGVFYQDQGTTFRFVFHGWVFNAAYCTVTVENGRVVQKETIELQGD